MAKQMIIEKQDGYFTLHLSSDQMRALVSMVRLEIGSGWYDCTKDSNDDTTIADSGWELYEAIQKIW